MGASYSYQWLDYRANVCSVSAANIYQTNKQRKPKPSKSENCEEFISNSTPNYKNPNDCVDNTNNEKKNNKKIGT